MNQDLKQIISQEYIKCAQNPAHFMKKYCFISHPQRGRVIFNLYPFQGKVLNLWKDNPYSIVLKSRQLGISTLAAGYSLWLMIFHKDKNILCLSKTQETARNMVTKVKYMYDNLPSWLKVPSDENNKLSLRLNNGSQIKAKSSNSDAARSEAVSLLIIDEAAFIENIEETWASAQQTLATGGGAIVLSTPYGTGNWFHQTWVAAESGENDFLPIKLPWFVHPERDEAWRKKQDDLLGDPRLAAQECFSGDVIIYTKHGPKPIKDIKIGDIVLSHDGTYNKVTKTFTHESNDIYEINTTLNKIKKYVTSNHPWLDENNNWVETKNVNNNWINLFPIVNYNNDNKSIDLKDIVHSDSPRHYVKYDNNDIWITKKHKSPRKITFNYDLGFILGLYFSEGSIWENVVCYSYNAKTEKNGWVLDLERKLNKIFNIKTFSHHVSKQWEGSGNVYIKSKLFKQFIEKCFDGEKYCQKKHISEWVYENASKECLQGILDGIMMGDGIMKQEYSSQIWLTSELLIYDIMYIHNILGIYNTSVRKGINTFPNGNHDINYCVNLLSSKVNSSEKIYSKRILEHNINEVYEKSRFLSNDKPYIKLKLEKSNKKIQVYNFEVENTHTYVTEYGVVHNCDCDFNTSGDIVFYSEWMDFIKETTIQEPSERRGADKNLWIWEQPDYSRDYMVVADVARGDGKDFSAFHIIDIASNTQVAEYKGQLPPKEFGYFLVGIATEYNQALLVVENANVGWATIDAALERGYKNFYYSPKSDTLTVDSYFNKFENSEGTVPGFTMSLKSRPLVINKFREYVGDRSVNIRSKRLLEEMKVFIWKNGRAEAQSGYNDDLVMSFGIGMYLRDTSLKFKQQSQDLTRAALNGLSKSTPAQQGAYFATGRDNPYYIDNKKGGMEDISWILG